MGKFSKPRNSDWYQDDILQPVPPVAEPEVPVHSVEEPEVSAAPVEEITEEIEALAGGAGSNRGTGGMITKIHAAKTAGESGIPTVIINGTNPEDIYRIIEGRQIGTFFCAKK